MQDILCLTLQYQMEFEEQYLQRSRTGLQGAANTFQTAIIKGFSELHCRITVMNSLPVGTFPFQYKDLVLRSRDWKIQNILCREIGGINFPLIKQSSRYWNYWNHIKAWLEDGRPIEKKCIIAYSLYLPFLMLLDKAKREYPKIKTSVICTDLPCQYGILPSNRIKAALYKKYGILQMKYTQAIDSFVLLTEAMKIPLNVGQRPFTVIEGIADAESYKDAGIKGVKERKVILYTGTLHHQYGIMTLLQAFEMIQEPDYELWICGSGDAENDVKALAEIDQRIRFWGYVPKQTIYKLQEQATILVNPRTNEGEYTKYSFPSKTMEYMMSGIPVVMHKLHGIPDEYDPYLFYVEDNTAEALSKRMKEICELSEEERDAFGLTAREFVAGKKNARTQAEKILNMVVGFRR